MTAKRDRREYLRQWRANNKERLSAYGKAWRAANPEKRNMRSENLKRRYGLTEEAWDSLFNTQGRCCAICGAEEAKCHNGWHTDHDHSTGAVRGILCRGCNHLIGHAEDNADTLIKAADYLNERRNVLPRAAAYKHTCQF